MKKGKEVSPGKLRPRKLKKGSRESRYTEKMRDELNREGAYFEDARPKTGKWKRRRRRKGSQEYTT